MKHLNELINEAIDQSLRSKLLELIDDPDLSEKAARRALNDLKYTGRLGLSTGEKTSGVHKKYVDNSLNRKKGIAGLEKSGWEVKPEEIFDADDYNVYKRLSNINIENHTINQIINILMDDDEMDNYIDYIKNSTVDSLDLINSSNVFDLLKVTNIGIKTLKKIAALKDGKNTISQGQYEILIRMFLSDLHDYNHDYDRGHGDIHAGGYSFELKGETARIGNPKHPIKLTYDKLNELSAQYNLKFKSGELSGKGNIENVVKKLYETIQDDRKVFDIMYQSFCAQFENYTDKLSEADKNYITKCIFKNGNILSYKNNNGLKRLQMAVQLYNYYMDEKFDYLMLINISNGDYHMIKSSSELNNIKKIFDDGRIGVTVKGGGEGRDVFCQIEYQK